MKFLPLVAIGFLLASSFVFGRDIYIDNQAGDDLFAGLRPTSGAADGPVRTISQGLRRVKAGDRLVIANTGVAYNEAIALVGARHSGYPDAPFVVEGNGAVIDGRAPVPRYMWESAGDALFRFQPLRQAYGVLYLGDRPAKFRSAATGDHRPPKLEPLEWTLADGYVWFRAAPTKLVDDYRLSYSAAGVGVTLYRVRDVVIRNLIVQGFQLDGLNAHDGVRDCRLINIISRGNGRSGAAVANSSVVMIEDCLLGDNLATQLWTEGWSQTYVFDSYVEPYRRLENSKLAIIDSPTQ